jgi:hypothetical protein
VILKGFLGKKKRASFVIKGKFYNSAGMLKMDYILTFVNFYGL